MNKMQAKLILTYAQSNMSARITGEKLFRCTENVHYHLRKIRDQMGWDPREFFDLCYLVGIAAQRLRPEELYGNPLNQQEDGNAEAICSKCGKL